MIETLPPLPTMVITVPVESKDQEIQKIEEYNTFTSYIFDKEVLQDDGNVQLYFVPLDNTPPPQPTPGG